MKVCQVAFKKVGKRYYFNPNNLDVEENMAVVVETIRGQELGHIVGPLIEIDNTSLEIKPLLRIATKADLEIYEQNKVDALEVIETTKKEVKRLSLDMKVLEAEFTLDHLKLIIYFEAEGRIDFRELVRNLAEIYHLRIELRQVGSRDGTKVFGGVGPCGLVLCCHSFITEFDTITVKMAKNQNLALNPAKINGACGRLLCCLAYEDEQYTMSSSGMPSVGETVETTYGEGKVVSIDILNRKYKVLIGSEVKEIYLENEKAA